jgi:anti-anti-sigma factor
MSDDVVLPSLSVTVDATDDRVVIAVKGEIDIATVEKLDQALAAIDILRCRTVVVDLAGVSFIDSTGLRALLVGRQALSRHDIRLVVCNPQPQARRLFHIALKGEPLAEVPSPLLP